jgi:plasmid stability protein
MPTVTLRNVPESLLESLRKRAVEERRSLNQEAIHLLEESLGAVEKARRAEAARDEQVQAWRRLAGEWRSSQTVAEEIADIYSARSGGREVEL